MKHQPFITPEMENAIRAIVRSEVKVIEAERRIIQRNKPYFWEKWLS